MAASLTPLEYRLLVESSPVMIWRAGLDASCDYFNETWLAFTGRTIGQEMGNGWAEGVDPEDFDRCLAYYLDHFGRREPFEMEYRLRRHDGVYRWILDRGVPLIDERGAFTGYVGSCVDVDERRRAQEAQKQYDQEQLALAHDFERFILAIVSHDIRNPLHTIQLAAAGLERVDGASEGVKKCAGLVQRNVQRIDRIVADLLDMSREKDGGGIRLRRKPLDLRALCRQVVAEIGAVSGARAISFDCNADAQGMWDEQRLMQAISNLVSNAVQHGQPDRPVRVRLSGDAGNATVEVRNAGEIPAALLPRVFEAFRARDEYRTRGEGLGLGLFIAQAIARAHGGVIEVEAAGGETAFRLVLPRE